MSDMANIIIKINRTCVINGRPARVWEVYKDGEFMRLFYSRREAQRYADTLIR